MTEAQVRGVVSGEPTGEHLDVRVSGPTQGPEGRDASLRISNACISGDCLRSLFSQLGKEPDRAGAEVGIFILSQGKEGWD